MTLSQLPACIKCGRRRSSVVAALGQLCGSCRTERAAQLAAERARVPAPREPARAHAAVKVSAAPGDWAEQAACAGMDADLWFPSEGETAAAGKAICSTCPVKLQCLEYALQHRIAHGVWGACSPRERSRILRRRRRAA